MQRFASIKNNKAYLVHQSFASAATIVFWLSLSATSANGAPGCGGSSTPNGNAGLDYVISGAETHTCTLTTSDTLVVQNGGSIVTGGNDGNAVESVNTPTSVVNNGLISASEDFMAGVNNSGILPSFVNTGTIQGVGNTTAFDNSGTVILLSNNGGTITSGGTAINNSGMLGIANNGGEIESTNTGNAIFSSIAGTLHLNNTNGLITSQNHHEALRIVGDGTTINNTNGIIQAQTGSAISISGPMAAPFINTGGLLTSASDDDSEGTLDFQDDMGNLTIVGGTIINTDSASNDRLAVSFNHDQTGVVTFDGVTIIADGTGVAQGYAIYIYEYDGNISLTSTTLVRGQIYQSCCGTLNLTTSGTIIGNITTEDEADSITVNDGSITGNIAMLNDDDVFKLNGGTVTGNVDMGSGDDTFEINGGRLNGNAMLGSGNDLFSYTGGILNGNVDFGNGVNELFVNAVWEPTSTFTTNGAGATKLHIGSSGHFIVNNPLNLQSGMIEVDAGGMLHLKGANINGAGFTNAGATRFGVGRSVSVGVFDNTSTGLLIFDTRAVNNVMKTGFIQTSEGPGDLSKQTVQVNYLGGMMTKPNRSLIFDSTGTAVVPAAKVTDNSFFYDFAVQVDPNNPHDLYLVLTNAKTIEDVTSSPVNAKTANVLLNDLAGTTDPVIQQIQQKLNNVSSAEEFNQIIESTKQTVDQGNQVAAVGMTGAMFDLADGQLAMVNTGDTGVSGGNTLTGLHFWGQGFGGWADQDLRKGAPGYEANVRGMALGVDTRNFDPQTLVGLSLGFANTDVRSDNSNATRTDVESYQLMAYGNHELGGDAFLTGMALYGWNRNEQTRFNVGGIAGTNGFGEYDSWVGGLRSSVGRNFHLPTYDARAIFLLTPQLFSEYVHFNRDRYTETGAGGAGIIAGDASQTIWNLGLSLQAEWTFVTENGGRLKPDIHATYKHDMLGEAADTTSTFVAGGSTIAIEAVNPAKSAFGIGVGLKFYDTSGWDFAAAYDYTFKDEYEAHSAYLRAAYEF